MHIFSKMSLPSFLLTLLLSSGLPSVTNTTCSPLGDLSDIRSLGDMWHLGDLLKLMDALGDLTSRVGGDKSESLYAGDGLLLRSVILNMSSLSGLSELPSLLLSHLQYHINHKIIYRMKRYKVHKTLKLDTNGTREFCRVKKIISTLVTFMPRRLDKGLWFLQRQGLGQVDHTNLLHALFIY